MEEAPQRKHRRGVLFDGAQEFVDFPAEQVEAVPVGVGTLEAIVEALRRAASSILEERTSTSRSARLSGSSPSWLHVTAPGVVRQAEQ